MRLPKWLISAWNRFDNYILKWKWFPLVFSFLISASIFSFTTLALYSHSGEESQSLDLISIPNKGPIWLKIINEISFAVLVGGAFTAFLKFFQIGDLFKDELKQVILDENVHLEKSRKERDNIFIDNVQIYSSRFLFESAEKIITRLFSDEFKVFYGEGYGQKLFKRLNKDLSISFKNNYIQKRLRITFTIQHLDENHFIVIQDIKSRFKRIGKSIKIDHAYKNWIPTRSPLLKSHEPVEILKYKIGRTDYKNQFQDLPDDQSKNTDLGDTLRSRGIKVDINNSQVNSDFSIKYILSSETFQFWKHVYGVYTKDVAVDLNYDKKLFSCHIMEFTHKEKFEDVNRAKTYMRNENSIFIPDDSFVLVIHQKK